MKEGLFPFQSNPNRVETMKKPPKSKLPLHHRAVIYSVNRDLFHTSFTIRAIEAVDFRGQCEGFTLLLQAEGGAL
jgi:hypothetical protein